MMTTTRVVRMQQATKRIKQNENESKKSKKQQDSFISTSSFV
jgi:hypothetical protein